jgi:hypothetical protein
MYRFTENMNSTTVETPCVRKKHISKAGIKTVAYQQMKLLKEPSFVTVKSKIITHFLQSKACPLKLK